jgi:hypothetical protein
MLMEQLVNIEKIEFNKSSIPTLKDFRNLEKKMNSSIDSDDEEDIIESKEIEVIENQENKNKEKENQNKIKNNNSCQIL